MGVPFRAPIHQHTMSCKKLLLVVLLVHLANAEPPLVGIWVENDSVRTGLYDFLWARGVSYFKRMYAAKWSTWKYEQTIIKEGNGYRISGISKINHSVDFCIDFQF